MTANPRIATLKNVPISFTDSLKTAKATVTGGVPKHGCNILVLDDQPETEANIAAVEAALAAASLEKWEKADKWKTIQKKDAKRVQWRAGETYTNSDDEVYNGYEGAMVISGYGPGGAKNPKRPLLMDRAKKWVWNPAQGAENVNRIPDVFYSGVRCDLKVEFYGVSGADSGGDGIFATIQVIRSREVGDRMGGGYTFDESEADDFDDLEDDDGFDV